MKKWVLKALLQKTIALLPWKEQVNYVFQRHISRGLRLTLPVFENRLELAITHLQTYASFNQHSVPKVTFEIGTGWHPIVPIAFFLSGVDQIYTLDHKPHLRKKLLCETIDLFVNALQQDRFLQLLAIQQERFEILLHIQREMKMHSRDQILQQLHICYHVEVLSTVTISDHSIDLVHSNNTFAHIYSDELLDILKQCKRFARKDNGVLSHQVDLCDHFAHFDPAINVYHFLRYSDKQWRWIDNSLQSQSRNRLSDYRAVYQQAELPITEEQCVSGNEHELRATPVHKKFEHESYRDLLVTHALFITHLSEESAML